ncbi:MAG: double-strand break repair helicase AddA [Candidatus Marinimicrobia bacterium]|nr:double-strand break repair helicase AddA [Candidatus Neomarinimicrobiota bacterium]
MSAVDAIALANRSQSRAIEPCASVWVSASAGSGKTKVLTDRVLAILLSGTVPQRILCLTFTKAAAAEMNNRILNRLAKWVTAKDEILHKDVSSLVKGEVDEEVMARARRLFAEVLDAPGGLQISTLHAFCQSLLRRFPLEADVAPHFALLDERDTAEVVGNALEETIAHSHGNDSNGLSDALSVLTARVHESNFSDLMKTLIAGRGKLMRMFADHGGLINATNSVYSILGLQPGDTKKSLIEVACTNSAFDGIALKDAATVMAGGLKTDKERAKIISDLLDNTEIRCDIFETYTSCFINKKNQVRDSIITPKRGEKNPLVVATLRAEAERLLTVVSRLKALGIAKSTSALLQIGADFLKRFNATKSQNKIMDYDDLIQKTRKLLERPGVAEWVLYKLDGGIDHILIDEAQDTNPEQWAIVKPLRDEFFAGRGRHEEHSNSPRTIFAVGDRKQSIYSFQGAEPQEFDRERSDIEADVTRAGLGWEEVNMNVSFRSAPAILSAVDAVFEQDTAKNGIVLSPEEKITHLAARKNDGGLVEIWPCVEPEIADAPAKWKPPVERNKGDSPQNRLAALLAARIESMVKTKEILESKGRPIRPGDIMVLVRRRTGFVEELVRQLKQRGISVAGVDRMVLNDQIAVMDLIALGEFLLLPEDDLTLATVLRSPLVGLSEEDLFRLAHARGKKCLWDVLNNHSGADSSIGLAQEMLANLLALTDYLTPVELYGHVLVSCNGRRNLLARLGADADDPIDEFLNLALNFEKDHPPSLQGFLHWLSTSEVQIKRDLDQTNINSVRVITVHGAKGLQAPIVFLPDTTQVPTMREQILWTDSTPHLPLWVPKVGDLDPVTSCLHEKAKIAQEHEYHRLMYVAMTRAEDRLYVCGWKTRKPIKFDRSWYSIIHAGLSSKPQTKVETDGFITGESGFLNTKVLRLTSNQTGPVKKEDHSDTISAPAPFPSWGSEDPQPEANPPQPLSPSRSDHNDPPALSPLGDNGRMRYQRGLIIHRLLQSLPDLPPARRRTAAKAYVGRSAREWDETTQNKVISETMAILENPRFAPLFAPGSQAEVPLTGLIGKFVVSGQVDRLAVTDTEIWIIDYKTNRPAPRAQENVSPAYIFQMATYRAALGAIYPDRIIHCVLLWTHGDAKRPLAMELDSSRMDKALQKADLL